MNEPSPYAAPKEHTTMFGTERGSNAAVIVDRESRDKLVAAMNRYLDGQATAFQFDDEIFDIASADSTVSHVVCELWCFYDDCKDHKVRLSKEAWNYFQRLILLLQSNAHIEVQTRRVWDCTQLIAAASLLLFILSAIWLGFGCQLLALAIPFGAISIGLSCWRGRSAAKAVDTIEIGRVPFSSLSELIAVRRSMPPFKKRKYPASIKPFRIRTPLEESMIKLMSYAAWLLFSPPVLLFQAFPTTEKSTRIVME